MVGQTAQYPAREEVGRSSIRYFATALDDENPVYVDEEAAFAAGFASIVAPPTMICESCQFAGGKRAETGYIGHEWSLPLEGCRMIRAGNDYEFFRPVVAADRIGVEWELTEIVEKPSSRGGTQLFVTSLGTYRDAAGETVATNREVVVYQRLLAE